MKQGYAGRKASQHDLSPLSITHWPPLCWVKHHGKVTTNWTTYSFNNIQDGGLGMSCTYSVRSCIRAGFCLIKYLCSTQLTCETHDTLFRPHRPQTGWACSLLVHNAFTYHDIWFFLLKWCESVHTLNILFSGSFTNNALPNDIPC